MSSSPGEFSLHARVDEGLLLKDGGLLLENDLDEFCIGELLQLLACHGGAPGVVMGATGLPGCVDLACGEKSLWGRCSRGG